MTPIQLIIESITKRRYTTMILKMKTPLRQFPMLLERSYNWMEMTRMTSCTIVMVTTCMSLAIATPRTRLVTVTLGLGLYRNRSVGESEVIRLLSIIHSGIILDLVCGFGGSVGEDVRFFSSVLSCRGENPSLISASARVRSGDPDRFSSRRSVGAMRVGRT